MTSPLWLITSAGHVLPGDAKQRPNDPARYWCHEGDGKWTAATAQPAPKQSKAKTTDLFTLTPARP